MDEYLRFENAIFCSSNCKFLKISAHNLSLILIFLTFLFLIMYLQLSILPTLAITILQKAIEWVSNPVFSVRYFAFFPVSSTFCLSLIIPNITPWGLFSGVALYMEGVCRFKSWFVNARGLYKVELIMGILRYLKKSSKLLSGNSHQISKFLQNLL